MTNLNFTRYVGFQSDSDCSKFFFSQDTTHYISREITKLLDGVHPSGRPIVVPNERINEVMNDVYISYRPPTGDIYSRYIVPSDSARPSNYINTLIKKTIQIIYSTIKTDIEQENNNRSLSAWTQVYGDFNKHGLRSHSTIKLREKRPQTMQFNMNY